MVVGVLKTCKLKKYFFAVIGKKSGKNLQYPSHNSRIYSVSQSILRYGGWRKKGVREHQLTVFHV